MQQRVFFNTPLTSTEQSSLKLRAYKLFHFFFGWLGRLYLSRYFDRVEVIGRENLKGGPKLLLMNHSCPLDPLLITFYGRQPLQFLITEAFMQGGLGTKLASLFGQISKRKLDFDTSSIRMMKSWCDHGAIVATFPEGQFSWDGMPGPLMPGIDQLVRYLKVPVITVRLINGDRVKPAWAKHYRKTSIRIEIDAPKTFEMNEDIQAYIREKIYVDNSTCKRWPVKGNQLSVGLKKLIRFCPYCESDQALEENDNQLSCFQCKSHWRVTPENMLQGENNFSITSLLEKTYKTLDNKWSHGEFCESLGTVEIFDISKKDWQFLTKGKLELTAQSMKVNDFEINCADIQAHTLDWGDLIILRTRFKRFAVKMPEDSRAIWTYLLNKVMV